MSKVFPILTGIATGACLIAAADMGIEHKYGPKAATESTEIFVRVDGLNKGFHCEPPSQDELVKSIKKGTDEIAYVCPDGVRELTIFPKKGTIITTIIPTGQTIAEKLYPTTSSLNLATEDLGKFLFGKIKSLAKK